MDNSLQAVAIYEKDVHGSILLAWSYPILEEEIEPVLLARSLLKKSSAQQQPITPYIYSKYKGMWHYSLRSEADSAVLPNLDAFSIVVLSTTFNPEKYAALLALLVEQYSTTGNPTSVLQGYLSVFTTGMFQNAKGRWSNAEYVDNRALITGCSIKEVIRMFGLEVVLLWNAMVLKKRVVVYCDVLQELLQVMRALPQFVWHRQDWSLLRPFVAAKKSEMADLTSAGVYVAGFVDAGVRGSENLYDLFVDVPARTIKVANNSKADFAMGQLHKDIATFIVEQSETQEDQTIIKGLVQKTKELRDTLQSWCTQKPDGRVTVTREELQAKNMPKSMERFLFNLAIAENMV